MVGEKKIGLHTKWLAITSLVAGLLLIVVNSAVWVNQQVFDTANFTNTTVSSITSESSRQALGARIVDEALKNNPVLKSVAGDRIAGVLSGLFGTDQANKIFTAAASKLQIYVTSSNQQDVAIDLSGLKSTLTRLANVIGNEETARINPENIPEKIVFLQAANVPDLYAYAVALNFIAPLGFIAAIILLGLPYYWDRTKYLTIMFVQGGVLIAAGLISLLFGPLFRPVALGPIPNEYGRVIVGNLYDAFIGTFNSQTLILVYIGLLVCLVAFIIWMYPRIKTAVVHK
jgi:hypothetical protein